MSKILNTYKAKEVKEGAGVIVNRVFGYGQTEAFDPFLMLDYFKTESNTISQGFPWHPHKGIETITYMLRGKIQHEDSMGNKGVLGSSELQWMTAGSGVMHQEMPLAGSEGYEGFQFWVNLKSTEKLTSPKYKYINAGEMKSYESKGMTVHVISGSYKDIIGPIDKSSLGINMFHVKITKGQSFDFKRNPAKMGYIFVFKGKGLYNNEVVEAVTAYTISPGVLHIEASKDLEFIYAEGTPLKEPIAWHGPIVMNTREEIQETFNDLNSGTFIKGEEYGN